jgi:hypothetical protein
MSFELTLVELAIGSERSWFGVIVERSEVRMVVQLNSSLYGDP